MNDKPHPRNGARHRRVRIVPESRLLVPALLAVGLLSWSASSGLRAQDFLPALPKTTRNSKPVVTDDLVRVPEAEFEAAIPKGTSPTRTADQIAQTLLRINDVNKTEADGFIKALQGQRTDLAGLPFLMGDACRTRGDRSRQFALAVALVRRALNPASVSGDGAVVEGSGGTASATVFWTRFRASCAEQDEAPARGDRELVTTARVAALMQVLAPEAPAVRLGLVKYLSEVAHPEATRALARLAVFTPEDEVRLAALDALKVRRGREYADVLGRALRYPWPAVARRAADAAVRLKRTDLIPQLVDLLDEPDPRAPTSREVGGKKTLVVNELVRVNHHRNCLLCHAPGTGDAVSPDALTAGIPVPGEALAPERYYLERPTLVVRVDMTYLRQDFSALLPVAEAAPWPDQQRFDFLVRTRELTADEADAYRTAFGADRPSPYRQAALAALRELTGRDAEPTAAAWRTLLDLPAHQRTANP